MPVSAFPSQCFRQLYLYPELNIINPFAMSPVKVDQIKNRPDEWKIEQGLSGAVLPVLDMTGPETKSYLPQVFGKTTKDEEAIKSVGDREKLFKMERKGWKG